MTSWKHRHSVMKTEQSSYYSLVFSKADITGGPHTQLLVNQQLTMGPTCLVIG